MTRAKFVQRKVLLRTQEQVERAVAALRNAPLDEEKPLEFLLREEVKERKLTQQGYYWIRLGEIADQAWIGNRQFNSDTWHEYAKRHLMPEEITTGKGESRSKWIELPDGSLSVISTTELDRACFAEYTTIVEAYGAGLGVEYSANPKDIK